MVLLPRRSNASPLATLIRILALALVLLVVIWAFWQSNERTIQHLQTRQAVFDATGALDEEDTAYVKSFAANLKETYGVEFRLQAVESDLNRPELDAKTLFVGVIEGQERVILEFPPLLRGALGTDFIQTLPEVYFSGAFDAPDGWVDPLKLALAAVWDRLQGLENQ